MKRDRNGQALVMMTMSIFAMLGMMSLAVDIGWANYRRDTAQSAADAAASAVIRAAMKTSPSSQACGTSSVWCGTTAGTITACPSTTPTSASTSFDNGCMVASNNGFKGSAVTIQANTTSPAPTVPGTTVSYWATVRITDAGTSFFGSLGTLTATARATAAITTSGVATSPGCMYLLGTTGTDLTIGNNAHVTASGCGVYDNSASSGSTPALTVYGSGNLTASSIKVVGGVPTGGWTNNGGTISPASPTTGVTPIADPFAGLPSPTKGTCSSGNFTTWVAGGYNLSAGCYNGMSFGNGVNATLGSGIYIVNGGTFSVQGGITLTGTSGVMIYLTNGATVNIANGVTVNMNAMSTGSYQGILFYQDRTMTSPAASTFAGGSTNKLSGTLYFPNSLLNINNGSSTATEAIVASAVNFQGGTNTLVAPTSTSQTGLAVGGSSVVSVIE